MDHLIHKNVYFLGIGGAALTPIAKWCLWQDRKVYGYDKTKSENTESLEKVGVAISYNDDISEIPKEILDNQRSSTIIYTPSLGNNNPDNCKIFSYLKNKGYKTIKRSDFFREITKKHKTVALAGTHGKTSTTALLSHIMLNSSEKVVCFVGATIMQYNQNFLYNSLPNDDYTIIIEADEYDRFFQSLNYDFAMVTTNDPDHLDYYENSENFREAFLIFLEKSRKEKSKIFLQKKVYDNLIEDIKEKSNIFSYGQTVNADISIAKLEKTNDGYFFFYEGLNNQILSGNFPIPGEHQLENLCGVISIALEFNVDIQTILKNVKNFPGVSRRFRIVYEKSNLLYIDDFAHHPVEIEQLLKGINSFYGEKKVFIIFQPHMYSRTKSFINEFAKALSNCKYILILNVYAAREEKIIGGTAHDLYEKITVNNKYCDEDPIEILKELHLKNELEIILTVGAGDIFYKFCDKIINFLMTNY